MVQGDTVLVLTVKILVVSFVLSIPWLVLLYVAPKIFVTTYGNVQAETTRAFLVTILSYIAIVFTSVAVFIYFLLGWVEENFKQV